MSAVSQPGGASVVVDPDSVDAAHAAIRFAIRVEPFWPFLIQILMMPRYMLAVAAGVVSYGLMAFVMTAAPIAMVNTGPFWSTAQHSESSGIYWRCSR